AGVRDGADPAVDVVIEQSSIGIACQRPVHYAKPSIRVVDIGRRFAFGIGVRDGLATRVVGKAVVLAGGVPDCQREVLFVVGALREQLLFPGACLTDFQQVDSIGGIHVGEGAPYGINRIGQVAKAVVSVRVKLGLP